MEGVCKVIDCGHVISAVYQAQNDKIAREKIRMYVRDSVIEHQITWLITIHRSDEPVDLSELNIKSTASIELKEKLSDLSKWNDDFIWIEHIDGKSKFDPDITDILDYLQDDGEPEAIEVAPGCIEFPKDINVLKDQPEIYPISTLGCESIDKRFEFSVPGLKCAPWRPGRACIAVTRIVQNRQFESKWEVI